MPSGVGASAVAATGKPSAAASSAVGRPMAMTRQWPKGGRVEAIHRAVLGEAATTASMVPASRSLRIRCRLSSGRPRSVFTRGLRALRHCLTALTANQYSDSVTSGAQGSNPVPRTDPRRRRRSAASSVPKLCSNFVCASDHSGRASSNLLSPSGVMWMTFLRRSRSEGSTRTNPAFARGFRFVAEWSCPSR